MICNIVREPAGMPTIAIVDVSTVHQSRGWFIGLGLIFMVLGVLAVLLPFLGSLVTTLFIGWLMMIGGFVQGVHAVRNRRWAGSAWAIVGALVYIVAGFLAVVFPVTGTLTLTLILAAFFTAQGLLKIIRAVQHRAMAAWPWLLFDGVLSLALGLLVGLGWPSTAAWALGLLVGIELVFSGASMLLIGLGAGSRLRARA